ncbi:hypothetical protein Q9966_013208 [Columba livia]|nr:hypothetical protein Q9966_013208 [Columba livia]
MEMDDQGGNEALHYLSSISEIVKGCAEIGGEIKKERMARRAGELIKNLLGLYLDRRVQSPLLNQTRPSLQGGKSQHMQQRWRSKGYRCIGGVMYQVSANKLSKTSSTPGRGRDLSAKSPGRAARLLCTPSPGSSPSSCLNRSATSRYIASRAVQRSLAIIRQAKQKKKKKEYCMYYNRFGKCFSVARARRRTGPVRFPTRCPKTRTKMLPVNGGIDTALIRKEIRRIDEQKGIEQEEPDRHDGFGKLVFPSTAA